MDSTFDRNRDHIVIPRDQREHPYIQLRTKEADTPRKRATREERVPQEWDVSPRMRGKDSKVGGGRVVGVEFLWPPRTVARVKDEARNENRGGMSAVPAAET